MVKKRPQEYLDGVSARLRIARRARGLSQRDVCAETGVKESTYSHWENGKMLIDPYIAAKISHAYGITTDYLYAADTAGLSTNLMDKIKKLQKK